MSKYLICLLFIGYGTIYSSKIQASCAEATMPDPHYSTPEIAEILEISDDLETQLIQATNDPGLRDALNLLTDQWHKLSPTERTEDLTALKSALVNALLFLPKNLLPPRTFDLFLGYHPNTKRNRKYLQSPNI